MTILLYDYLKLEERAARHLRVWKIWHVILYALAAVFGVLNYIFLQNTMVLVNENCILYPRNLSFHMVKKHQDIELSSTTINSENVTNVSVFNVTTTNATTTDELVKGHNHETSSEKAEEKNDKTSEREAGVTTEKEETVKNTSPTIETRPNTLAEETEGSNTTKNEITVVVNNVTIVIENATHRLMLDTSSTWFGKQNDCQFAEFMPILSTIFAVVWATLFIMCPGGGMSRSGLQQPWRILTPSMLFAIVMVGLTGHSFSLTNGGLQNFCSAFSNLTNTTACSSVDSFLEKSENGSLDLGKAAGAARAGSAGAWAAWACAAAVLLARCISAPDFIVRRRAVYVAKDPLQKITPYLQKTPRSTKRLVPSSPNRQGNSSPKSEPTAITELVTVSVEPIQDSTPSSLMATPLKYDDRREMLDLTHSPGELFCGHLNK